MSTLKEKIDAIMNSTDNEMAKMAKIAKLLAENQVEEVSKTKEQTKKQRLNDVVVSLFYPDFKVTRTTAQTVKELTVMPTQRQIMLITTKNNGERDAKILDESNESVKLYQNFMNSEKIKISDDFWITELPTSKVGYVSLLKYINLDGIINMMNDGCAPKFYEKFDDGPYCVPHEQNIKTQLAFYQAIPKLYKEYHASESDNVLRMIKKSPGLIYTIYKRYGLEKARDFLNTASASLLSFSGSSPYSTFRTYYEGCDQVYNIRVDALRRSKFYINPTGLNFYTEECGLPYIEMNYETMRDYIFSYKTRRAGYGDFATLAHDWNESLRMQVLLYGKIKEKYPEHLPCYHNKLALDVQIKAKEIDAQKFEKQRKYCKKFEWNMPESEGGYMFVVPESTGDFINEAEQQQNCLKSYINRFQDGACAIVFMRDKSKPDESCVTIEIVDDRITQAKARLNRVPTQKEREAVRAFAKKFKLTITEHWEEIHNGEN